MAPTRSLCARVPPKKMSAAPPPSSVSLRARREVNYAALNTSEQESIYGASAGGFRALLATKLEALGPTPSSPLCPAARFA